MLSRLLLGAAVAGLLAAGGWWYGGVRADTEPAHATVEASRGDVERAVTAVGKIEPLQYVDVGVQVSGQLRRILVKPGDPVEAGDLLAEIDATVFSTRVEADAQRCMLSRGWNDPRFHGWAQGRSWGR